MVRSFGRTRPPDCASVRLFARANLSPPAVVQLSLEPVAGLVGHSLDAWALLRSGGDPRKMKTCAFMFHLAARAQAMVCLIACLFVYGVIEEFWRGSFWS